MKTKVIISFISLMIQMNLVAQLVQTENLKFHPQKRVLEIEHSFPIIEMPAFNLEKEQTESINLNSMEKPFIFAKVFDVEIDIKQQGYLEETEKFKRYTLAIKSKGAYSLNFTFSDFNIPQNAELYIYNSQNKSFIGAYTNKNNKVRRTLPIAPIEGELVIFDYTEPKDVSFEGKLVISKVGHDYKNIFQLQKDGSYGLSGNCNVDINCIQGNNWQNEKQSVCRLYINNRGTCSGTLINNINNNGRPYVLTANHCIASDYDANNTVFVFNYESPTCNGIDGSISQSIDDATLRSTWAWNSNTGVGTDFTLVELSATPPVNFQPYYSGWNTSFTPATSATGIHHPKGDVKKISVETSSLTSVFFPQISYGSYDHWKVADWDFGTTEDGSSGSPLYNQNHRIVGQLHGGKSQCLGSTDNGQSDYYGKLFTSWTGGGTDATRLQNWLAPGYGIVEDLPGLRLIKDADINTNTSASGDIVKLENTTIESGSTIMIKINVRFEATGTFHAPVGTTLNIVP